MRRTSIVILVNAAALGLGAASASQAAAQTTFRACRVPSVGVIYMIGVSGAPTSCLDASHVEFSWTEGSAPADGSVTTAKLADGAVTSAKIADGTVVLADVDATSIQARVAGSCAVGSSIRVIGSNGAVGCQTVDGSVAGSQVTSFTTPAPVAITSATPVQLHSLTIPGSTSGVATVVAHAYVEQDATAVGRYEFALRTGTCTGALVGLTWWRPLGGTGFQAMSVVVTGTVTGATGSTTIVFCGNKFDLAASNATAYLRGIIAHW